MRYIGLGQNQRMPHAFTGNWYQWIAQLMKQHGMRDAEFSMSPMLEGDPGVIIEFNEKECKMKVTLTEGRDDFVQSEQRIREAWLAEQTKVISGYKVRWSRDRSAYYLPDVTSMHGFWLGHPPIEREPTEEEKKNGVGFLAPLSQFQLPDGRKYLRAVWPFAYYEIKSGDEEVLPADSDIVLDYLATEKNWNKNK